MSDIYQVLLSSGINETKGLSKEEIIKTVISVTVPAIISIIGFIITYITLSRSYKHELSKQKNDIHIEKMSTIPYEVLTFLEEIFNFTSVEELERSEEVLNKFKNILNTIYAYGSADAIKLASIMQRENFKNAKNSENTNQYKIMALYTLLATQIKYDVTNIAISPDLWYQMKVTDYDTGKNDIRIENNKLVNDLKLNNSFLIA